METQAADKIQREIEKASSRSEFLAGVKAELPILIGVIPFGMIYGVLALGAGIPPGAAQAMSAIVFAGSAQFISAQLVHVGTPGLIIVVTAGIVNLRHALYSASMAPYYKPLRPLWKWLLAYLLTDEAYAVTITRYQQDKRPGLRETGAAAARTGPAGSGLLDNRHWFALGAGLALWATWQTSTAVGILLGAVVPPSWSLDFTLALTFIALVVPALQDNPSLAAAAAAGVVAVIFYGLPFKLGLVLAALTGIQAGLWLENRR